MFYPQLTLRAEIRVVYSLADYLHTLCDNETPPPWALYQLKCQVSLVSHCFRMGDKMDFWGSLRVFGGSVNETDG